MFSSHLRFSTLRTRQDVRTSPSITCPPQAAIIGFGSDVVNNVNNAGLYLDAGNEGGEHPLVLGSTSLEEVKPLVPDPPVRRTTVSSLTGGGASVMGPGNLESCQ